MAGAGGFAWFNSHPYINAVGVDPDRVIAVTEGRHIINIDEKPTVVLYLEGGATIVVAGDIANAMETLGRPFPHGRGLPGPGEQNSGRGYGG
jgi:hypothetical protein